MQAITICQPYASLIVGYDGMPPEILKRVENRTWPTRYRGPLAIHAGKSKKWLDTWGGPVPEEIPFGAILGIVELVDCVRLDQRPIWDDWLDTHIHASGPWCWILQRPGRLKQPVPYRGCQGLFSVPDDLLDVSSE